MVNIATLCLVNFSEVVRSLAVNAGLWQIRAQAKERAGDCAYTVQSGRQVTTREREADCPKGAAPSQPETGQPLFWAAAAGATVGHTLIQ